MKRRREFIVMNSLWGSLPNVDIPSYLQHYIFDIPERFESSITGMGQWFLFILHKPMFWVLWVGLVILIRISIYAGRKKGR